MDSLLIVLAVYGLPFTLAGILYAIEAIFRK
jgi:L-cystine uptake protein TcyP (sodium:dicarboxylate symporter family)